LDFCWYGQFASLVSSPGRQADLHLDPTIYDDPNRFDITRQGLAPILTFGAGVHYCLGANLARLEIAEALKAVTRSDSGGGLTRHVGAGTAPCPLPRPRHQRPYDQDDHYLGQQVHRPWAQNVQQ